eukprot:TRINITY_DN1600_c0_g1_i1.p1 TRINITY_DN1600_c0_g1~~TRINITY_DN1600_c0_g1_i1.p1  ORF type:complete len:506 (+),score=171.78 TRINITY_DN1600_c0_g1_i1:77-1594(+)
MSVQWGNEGDAKAAVRDVRNDSTPTDWVLFKYEGPKSQTIVVGGSGSGGLNELVGHLSNDMVGYGLIRKTDRIDESETVKFAFILYIGDKVGIMQKARISVHSGAVKDFIGQYHVDIMASKVEELSDEILTRKIQDTSGSGTRVLDESGARAATKTAAPRAAATSAKGSASSGVTFENREAIQELRAGGVNWILYSYENSNSNNVVLVGKGNGGVDELSANLSDDIVGYGLVRLIERIDESDTVKFAFINWTGDNVPRMLRARIGTHSGAVKEFLHPYHVDIQATHKSEVTEDIVVKTVKKAAGTASHIVNSPSSSSSSSSSSVSTGGSSSGEAPRRAAPDRAQFKSTASYKPAVNKQELGISIVDADALKSAIADVRNDSTDTNWVLATYEGANSNTIKLLGKGSGGADEMISHLSDDMVGYGLYRTVETFDLTQNVRFAFINWVGENIHRMLRAKLGTHSGAIKELFSPYHVDLHATNQAEISSDILAERIRASMGTKDNVKA